MTDIAKYIEQQVGSANSIYWSVENNSIGEAALLLLMILEKKTFRLFVSEHT